MPELSTSSPEPGAPGWRSWAGLLLLLAVTLPFQIWRARLEGSWWVDENESVLLASGPVARILDYCASDTNPPGYFLILKPWLALGRHLPGGLSALWARGPEILAWTLLLIFLWRRGRELLGPPAGAALAWAVASSAYAGWFVEARGFGISSAAALACGLLLWGLVPDAAAETSRPRRWKTWLAYVLLAEIALWDHLLSAVLLGLLAAVWLAAALRLRERAPWLPREGALAHGIVALAFSPWLIFLGNQIATRRNEDSWWVTPATLKQWLLVFFEWYPVGEADLPRWLWLTLGILALLAPLAAAAIAMRKKRSRPGLPGLLGTGAAALALALVYTSILWGLQRFLGLTVFHGPRYPGLATGFWAAGLALLSAGAVARTGWRPALVWLPLAPWLLAGWIGQHGESLDDRKTVFERHKERAFLPPPGATLFVAPASLYPYVRHILAGWQARPAADLPCALARMRLGEEAWLLDLNFLDMLDEPVDTLLTGEVGGGAFSRDVAVHHLLPPQNYTLYHLSGVFPRKAGRICREGGLRLEAPPIPGQAAAVALPASQRLREGWWWLDADAHGGYRRWWVRPRVPLRFDRPVGPGDYVLHYRGFCRQQDGEPHDLHLRLAGSSLDLHVAHRGGEVAVDAPVHLAAPLRAPILWLEHPMQPPERLGLPDAPVLQMGSELRYAWLERVGSGRTVILARNVRKK